jgi:TP901 family phage tail tape measure protein
VALNQLGLGLLFTATDMASGVMSRVRNGFAQTRDEAGRFGTRSKEAFKQFSMGAGIMVAGLGGLAVFDKAIEENGKLGRAITEVATEIDAATFSQTEMKKITRDLAVEFGRMPVEEAQALYDAVGFGANDAAKATDVMTAANRLAVAGVTDVKTAVSAVAGTAKAYGLSFAEATPISDAFFKAMTLGKTKVADLANAMPRATGIAASLGVEYDTLLASVSTLTGRNVEASEAVSGLKAAFSAVLKVTPEAEGEARRLGIQFSATALKTMGLQKFLGQLVGNTKMADDSMTKLFGPVEGANAILQLTAGGMQDFNGIMEAMKDKTGATAAGFKVFAESSAFQSDRLAALKSVALGLVGEALSPMATAIKRLLNSILEAFTKIPKPIRDFVVQLAAGAAALTAVVGAAMSAVAGIKIMAAAARFAGVSFSGLLTTIGPIVLIIAAVAAAIYAFKYAVDNNIGGIGDVFNSALSWIRGFFASISQLLTTGTLDEDMSEAFLSGEDSAVQWAVKVYQVVERVVNFFEGMIEGFSIGLEAAKPAFEALSAAFEKLGNALGLAIGPAQDAGAEFDAAGKAGANIGEFLAKGVELVVNVLTILIEIATGVVSMWDVISESIDSVGESFGEVGTAIGEVVNALGLASSSAGGSSSGWQALGQVLGGVVAVALQLVASLVSALASSISNLATMFSGVVDIIAGIASGDWPRVWNGMKKVVFGMVQGVIDMLLGLVQVVADTIDKIAGAVGKQSTLGKDLRAWRDEQKVALKEAMGVEEYAAAPKAPAPGVMANAPLAGAAPAVAAIPFNAANVDVSGTAAAAAARAAMAGLPPTHITATLNVDGEALGRLAIKANASEASRAGAAATVDVG